MTDDRSRRGGVHAALGEDAKPTLCQRYYNKIIAKCEH